MRNAATVVLVAVGSVLVMCVVTGVLAVVALLLVWALTGDQPGVGPMFGGEYSHDENAPPHR